MDKIDEMLHILGRIEGKMDNLDNLPKPLLTLGARVIGLGGEPMEAPRQGRGHDVDHVRLPDQQLDSRRNILGSTRRVAGCDQDSHD